MISHIDDSDDALRRKRLKVSSACAECRRRKIKCDGGPPCASCIKAKIECVYATSSNKLNMSTDKKQITIAITSALTDPIPPSPPPPPTTTIATTTNTLSFAAIKSKQHRQHPKPIKPSLDHRRFSTSFQPITSNMHSPSSVFSRTPPPITSRHSFSYPTQRSSYGNSQNQHHRPTPPLPRSTTTIASIEERLVSIEGFLRVILEDMYTHSDHRTTINNTCDANSSTLTTPLPPLQNDNHHHHHYYPPPSPISSINPSSSSVTTPTMIPVRSSFGPGTQTAPPPPIKTDPSLSPSPPPPVMNLLKPTSLSSSPPPPPLPPVISAFHSPHDPAMTPDQHFSQPNSNNKNTSIMQSTSTAVPSSHTPFLQ